MVSIDTYAFALVLVAASCAAAVWRTYFLTKAVREQASLHVLAVKRFEKLFADTVSRLQKVESQSPTALGAQVVELSEAVERLRKTHQRFAGRVDRERQLDDERPVGNDGPSDNPTYNALLKAQQSNPFPR